MELLARQIELEEEYSTASIVAGQHSVLKAFEQGRADELGAGKLLLARSFEYAHIAFKEYLDKPTRGGIGAKYKKLLGIGDSEALVMAGLREIINRCASPTPATIQDTLQYIGRIVETEAMVACMEQVSSEYTAKTTQYLDSAGTKSVHHRYRTYAKGASNINLNWETWAFDERIGAARLLCTILYDSTGLFEWSAADHNGMLYIKPTEVLAKHFEEVQSAARAIVKYPPMLIKPHDWTGQFSGGYCTEWFRTHAPMCGIRYIKQQHRKWIIDGLSSPEAELTRTAMNKAQSVPYRVNNEVLSILRKATAMRIGILGLPSFAEAPQPVFPLSELWDKANSSEADLEEFALWKARMAVWYTSEVKRKGRTFGILSRIQELARYASEEALYFPTFIDWRGRLYFRSNLNPQSSDAVRGCLEFAEGKPLGISGLHWLKVHVANSCGYDKHSPELKAKWCDDNWSMISEFINNPYDVDAPESDTAFALLQAGLALQEALALPDPTQYVCRVPVAMDASCSGLQHLSALTRDPIGALYTNLLNNNADQKSDIYTQVGETAKFNIHEYIADEDILITKFWEYHEITRSMSKKPVMTHVYSATLLNAIQEVALELASAGVKPIQDGSGKTIYSLSKISVCVGKALKAAVISTVPEADRMMKFLQKVVRSNKEECMRWVSPVGVPVVNWAEGQILKSINIRSMGVTKIVLKRGDGTYNTRIASNGIVPNFVHSQDASHLCMTIADFFGSILPIHDSFATHPSDVEAMHVTLRTQFIKLYREFEIQNMLEFNHVDLEEFTIPKQGLLDLNLIQDTPYMFG